MNNRYPPPATKVRAKKVIGPMSPNPFRNPVRNRRFLGVFVVGAALAVLLSACGGSPASSATTPTTNPATSGSNGSAGGGFPGASGQVAALSGTSMEVQDQQSGQVTVAWTSSTTFSKTITVSASNVAAGDCVTVVGSTSGSQLTARSVTIGQPDSSGNCTNRFGGARAGGGFPGGSPPSGSVPNRPSGSLPAGAANFGFASGKVTSINAGTLVIYGTSSSGFGSRQGGNTSTTATTTPPSSVSVTLNSSTTYTETQTAAASDLAVGDCVTANGSSDSTGAITARTVRITSTGGQSCTSGFGPGAGPANG